MSAVRFETWLPPAMRRIPFKLPDVGLREIRGSVYLSESFLILEIDDSLMGEFDRDIYTIEIDPEALDEVRFEKGLLKDRLLLRPETRQLLDAVPGEYAREVPLEIWRKYRSEVRRLERMLRMRQLGDAE